MKMKPADAILSLSLSSRFLNKKKRREREKKRRRVF
jgi:hypothetical protein